MADHADAAILYKDAAATIADLVTRVAGVTGWDGPGLGVWDLRALVGHASRALITVLNYLDRPTDLETIASPEQYFAFVARQSTNADAVAERGRQAGQDLGPQPQQTVADLVVQVVTKVDDADPETVIAVLGGGMRVRNYLPTRTFELVVHGFDISAAAGVDVVFSPEVMADAAGLAGRIAVAVGEGRTVLAALTGRYQLPTGFSILR